MTNSKQLTDIFGDFFSNLSALAEKEFKVILPVDDSEIEAMISNLLNQCRDCREIGTLGGLLVFAGLRIKALAEMRSVKEMRPGWDKVDMKMIAAISFIDPRFRQLLNDAAVVAATCAIQDGARKMSNDL